MKKTLLILCGGRSDEHEISLISAGCILKALDRARFEVLLVSIAKTGEWHLQNENSFFTGEFKADKIVLNTKAPLCSVEPFTRDGRGNLISEGHAHSFDVVFPILHGQFGEDGTLQGMLDIIGVPYVGSGCESSAICMDKIVTKSLCESFDIPVAPWTWVDSVEALATRKSEIDRLGFPLFIKPARQGSSVGVSRVMAPGELSSAVEGALKYDSKCLIEKGIKGREIEVAVLGVGEMTLAAEPGEIIPRADIGWYTYEAKYIFDDGAAVQIPAALNPRTRERARSLALEIFKRLECRGMARVDLFYSETEDRLYLNEVNTLPGFTPISMYPKMWAHSGKPYTALLNELIASAEKS